MSKTSGQSLWTDLSDNDELEIGRAASESFRASAHKFFLQAHRDEVPDNVIYIRPEVEDTEVLNGLRYAFYDALEVERKRRLDLAALTAGQAWLASNRVLDGTDTGLALRLHRDPASKRSPGYYVSRTYRGLWVILLIVGLVWGTISGFVLGSGSGLLSPSALLMGFLGTIVLALTLVSAGSRERIRRHRP